jgi:hypothetical protein
VALTEADEKLQAMTLALNAKMKQSAAVEAQVVTREPCTLKAEAFNALKTLDP